MLIWASDQFYDWNRLRKTKVLAATSNKLPALNGRFKQSEAQSYCSKIKRTREIFETNTKFLWLNWTNHNFPQNMTHLGDILALFGGQTRRSGFISKFHLNFTWWNGALMTVVKKFSQFRFAYSGFIWKNVWSPMSRWLANVDLGSMWHLESSITHNFI